MGYYAIKIEVWPFSNGGTAESARAEVAPAERLFRVRAQDFEGALTQARALRDGCGSHDKVWQAHIRSIDYQGERA